MPADRLRFTAAFALCAIALAGCHRHADGQAPGTGGDEASRPFAAITPSEVVHMTGTEPFWSGGLQGETLTFSTPSMPTGVKVPVTRFAGRNGLAVSGKLGDKQLDITLTPGTCSDGMSDRHYPYSVTLKLGEDLRLGCAWTNAKPVSDGAAK